ncbi:MAG: gamma-butyrobetaine hydroxylase-like domain-containing protein, partial [Candidatus Kapaibacterium sp.]
HMSSVPHRRFTVGVVFLRARRVRFLLLSEHPMPSYIPTSVRRPHPLLLTMTWDDGFSSTITLETFREECPCALCKGETIMGTTYLVGIKQFVPGMNELERLEPIGNYGVQATWKDKHDSGIYTWQMLRLIAEKNALRKNEIDDYMRSDDEKKARLN